MTGRALISKAALRKLPAKAEDGTPYCSTCRRYGELNPMIASDATGSLQCQAWAAPIYADDDRLTHQQLMAGEPCRGCGQELLPHGEPPSWLGKGSMYFTDEERIASDAAANVGPNPTDRVAVIIEPPLGCWR